MPTDPRLDALITAAQQRLRLLARLGCRGWECRPETLARLEAWDRPPTPDARQVRAPAGAATALPASPGTPPPRTESLSQVRTDLGDCRRCKLHRARTQIVFGQGNPRARLVFVGEGPGFEEDQQGVAFVGAAGQLLTKIVGAMNLTREAVYICNVVKCRPPRNRTPESDEIGACLPFLHRQLAAVAPDCICALGAVAARTLLETDRPISRLRGRLGSWRGIPLMPTYHPAYLLRNPDAKRAVWQDVQQVMKVLTG